MTMGIPAQRTGLAHLPLHGGHAPAWLFRRMMELAREITAAIIIDYSPDVMLRRLADPFWFQTLGCVPGYDWHLCGVSSVACGALEAGLAGTGHERGSFVAEDKGRQLDPLPPTSTQQRPVSPLIRHNVFVQAGTRPGWTSVALQNGCNLYHHRTR